MLDRTQEAGMAMGKRSKSDCPAGTPICVCHVDSEEVTGVEKSIEGVQVNVVGIQK